MQREARRKTVVSASVLSPLCVTVTRGCRPQLWAATLRHAQSRVPAAYCEQLERTALVPIFQPRSRAPSPRMRRTSVGAGANIARQRHDA